jgi:hypothetical protein
LTGIGAEGFCVSGAAGFAVVGVGVGAGFAVGAAVGFAAVEYLPESNRLITSPVISRDGST